jgi:hypothetical protein
MKLLFPLAALLSCVFLFFYLPLFMGYCDALDADFEQYRLDKALELSTRAASENGLTHGLIELDYDRLLEVEFNTDAVLDTYAQFMCFNYGLAPDDANREYVLAKSVVMAVGGRGFHVTQSEYGDMYTAIDGKLHRVSVADYSGIAPGEYTGDVSAGSKTVFGAYVPFAVKDPTDESVTVCGSLLDHATAFPIYTSTAAGAGVATVESLPGGVNVSLVRHEALAMMTRALTASWNQLNQQASYDKQLVLPDTITAMGVSSAANPGVMAFIEGWRLDTSESLRSEAFTGYKAILRRTVVAFTQHIGGKSYKYYCYEDQFDRKAYEGIVNYVYLDMYDAVKAGYQPHLGMLARSPI